MNRLKMKILIIYNSLSINKPNKKMNIMQLSKQLNIIRLRNQKSLKT